MKIKSLALIILLTVQGIILPSHSGDDKSISKNSIKNELVKRRGKAESDRLTRLKTRYLSALKPYVPDDNVVSLLNTNEYLEIDKFYQDFPEYNQGGEVIAAFNKDNDGNPINQRTELIDVMARYYDPNNGEYLYDLAPNYRFQQYGAVNTARPNLNVMPSYANYTKNNNSFSPCLTAAGLSILYSMSVTHQLQRPENISDKTKPYIFKKDESIGRQRSASDYSNPGLYDPFCYYYGLDNMNRKNLSFSSKSYKGFALVNEPTGNNYAYIYNKWCKMAAVMDSKGAGTLISSLAKFLEEDSLSENKNHRYTMTGTRKVIKNLDVQSDFIDYMTLCQSGAIGGDDNFEWPDQPHSSDPLQGHAFIIVGWGITSKFNKRLNRYQDIAEIIYDMGGGRFAAMPSFDLCDWFDLTIKKQNKEWFGWKSSTSSSNWYRG